MASRRPSSSCRFLALCPLLLLVVLALSPSAGANGVFKVRHKFLGRKPSVGDLLDHDSRRHSRILSSVDLPIGGLGLPTSTGFGLRPCLLDSYMFSFRLHFDIWPLFFGGVGGWVCRLYFAEIGIGSPSKKYYVQVDTGSDILWVNCISCKRCPQKSDLGVELTLYDPRESVSGSLVSCNENFCVSTYGDIPGCVANLPCEYRVVYGDGSSTAGFFVTDFVQYNQVSSDHQTKPVNASVTFG
ncbi:hypothetical protein B296_00003824 [Ensete ventricosum]|uniref:Peptidase A1 domain-containing protein n=1 Tax=Ensete ventricosum TaxID=4639 RepID=A0A426ZT59_ENSVE|nr:hypothetical protein B296_00003824 [Ensete ventricosum]